MWLNFTLVFWGGALGAGARYALSEIVLQHTFRHKFPYATFTVNILGYFLAGLLLGVATNYDLLSTEARLFLFTGLLGGFTIFSAFGVEVFHLLRHGDLFIALGYIIFSVTCGVAALFVAYSLMLGRKF